MFIDSKYTKPFRSHDLTRLKYDELRNFAMQLREHKNNVSQLVNSNLLKYLDYSQFEFMKEMRSNYKGTVASSFDAELYTQVLTCYKNKFTTINYKLRFQVRIFRGFERYKRNTSKHKIGDLKKVLNTVKTTPLSICLTYLAKYGKTNIKGVIIRNDQWPEPDYDEIKECQNRRFEYKYESDVFEFLKNKKENVKKLVKASNERKSRYVYDQDYMYVIDKKGCTITTWYMGQERNFERWKLSFSPKLLKAIEKEMEEEI